MTDSSLPEYPGRALWSLRRPASLGTGPRRPLGFLDTLAARGDFVPFMLARRPAVLLNRPDYVSTVLIGEAAKFHKGSANQRARHLLGNGLLTADGEMHAERRKLIQPAFARKRLDECAAVVVRRALAMCDRWRAGEVVDVADAIGQLTFGIVGETIVGGLVDAEFRQVQEAVSEAIASLDPLVSLVAPLRRVRRAQSRLRTVVAELASRATKQATEGSLLALLDARDAQGNGRAGPPPNGSAGLPPNGNGIAGPSPNGSAGPSPNGSAGPSPNGSAGLQPCHQPSEQRLDDLLTILVAGHDTITSALSWTLALVAAHPEVERDMRGELKAVLSGRDATAADVGGLVYTRAVLAESLRLYPPAWVLARHAAQSHCFDEGEVPAGTIVLISQYLLHRDERFFDRPGAFDPRRWLAGGADHPRFAYFPFGAGARACIGESFGWMEGVLLLATIAQRWQLRAVGPFPEIDLRITMRPRGPVLMEVRPL